MDHIYLYSSNYEYEYDYVKEGATTYITAMPNTTVI